MVRTAWNKEEELIKVFCNPDITQHIELDMAEQEGLLVKLFCSPDITQHIELFKALYQLDQLNELDQLDQLNELDQLDQLGGMARDLEALPELWWCSWGLQYNFYRFAIRIREQYGSFLILVYLSLTW